MDFDDLFKKENKNVCRWVGGVLVSVPLLYILSGGQQISAGISGWFFEWYLLVLILMFPLGIIFLLVGFRSYSDEDD